MKIVVDDKIPYIREKLQMLADQVVAIPGAKIASADVKDADALILGTRTRCGEKLQPLAVIISMPSIWSVQA